MVDTNDNTDGKIKISSKDYNMLENIKKARKRYYESHKDKIIPKVVIYNRELSRQKDPKFIKRKQIDNKIQYQKRKEKGITPEEKAAKAKYMREYRARKKQEAIN